MRAWLVLAVASLLTAGCGSPKASVQEVVVHSAPQVVNATAGSVGPANDPLKNTELKGHISGVVVDAAIHPLVGAVVTIPGLDLKDTAERDGSFSFTELMASTYYLKAEAPGHYGAETLVEVEAGKITRVKFVLDAVPPPTPYHVTQSFNGFAEITSEPLGIVTSSDSYTVDLDHPGATIVVEASMDPYSGAATGNNSFDYEFGDANGDSFRSFQQGSAGNPMNVIISSGNTENVTAVRVTLTPIGFPTPEFEKSYKVYVTAFYNGLPPRGWGILNGDT